MEPITNVEKVLEAAKKYVSAGATLPNANPGDGKSVVDHLMGTVAYNLRWSLLRDIKDYLDADSLAVALRTLWPDVEQPEPPAAGDCTYNEAVTWFATCNADELMGPLNVKLLKALPDIVTVYRGKDYLDDLGVKPDEVVSWTINPISAMEYPKDNRFGAFYCRGGYSASVRKVDILAYFYRNDMEVVVNPYSLFDVKEIEAMGEVLSDSDMVDLINEQKDLFKEYFNNTVYRDLADKLKPLGRIDELIDATMDFEKRKALVKELLGFGL